MARPAKTSSEDLLDAALEAAGRLGRRPTVHEVALAGGVPTGSIYHRFAAAEELFVALWLREIRRFQEGVFVAARLPDAGEALRACAVHVPRYCREQPASAFVLTLYRQRDLVHDAPAGLEHAVATLNDDLRAAARDLCRRRFGRVSAHRLDLIWTAVQQCPYGLVRPHLNRGEAVPAWLDDVVAASCTAILALGDT